MNDMAGSINARCADRLREAADLLEAQGANPFRVSAYRKAAMTVLELPEDLAARVDRDGLPGLEALPNIGRGIAAALLEMVRTGRWTQLERLRGSADPVQLLTAVPGLGHRLAERIHDELQVDTLEGLELVAHDGRLESVPGVGPRRAAAIRASLQTMLSRSRPHHPPRAAGEPDGPDVGTLLAVDLEYREKADSIPRANPGCRCCTRCAMAGISPRSTQTPRRRISSAARATGSSCTSTTTNTPRASTRSSPRRTVRSSAAASCADARPSAARTTRARLSFSHVLQ